MSESTITIFLLSILGLTVLGLVMVILWLYRTGPGSPMKGRIDKFVQQESIQTEVTAWEEGSGRLASGFGKFRNWLNIALSGLSSEQLQIKLSSAYWPVTDIEFIVIRILAAILGLALGWLAMKSVLGGLFFAILLILLPPVILDRAIVNRQNKFHNQLLDVLILIKGAVQAGYSLLQSLDLALKEMHAPASEEFGRVLKEVRFGFPIEQALTNLAERMENDDLQIVITAIIINSQVGGNLSTVLDATIDTIRGRMQLMSEVRSLTAYARYVGNFLSFLPFIAGGVIFLVTPDYFNTVTDSLLVQIIFGLALLGIIVGNIWIRRISRVRV